MVCSCALQQPLLKCTISHAKEPPCNNMYSTYKNWPPWENPNALYPSFNSGSLANCLQTSSTCLFAFRKKPFSISWNKKKNCYCFHNVQPQSYIFITITMMFCLSATYSHYNRMLQDYPSHYIYKDNIHAACAELVTTACLLLPACSVP